MANIAKEKIMEIEKLAKASARRVDSLTKDIDKIDAQIKELNSKKRALTNSIVSERNATLELDKLANQMENMDASMAELLYLGFATKYGLSTDVKVIADEKPVAKPKRKYNRRSKEELAKYKEWNGRIASLTKGLNENVVLLRAYDYMLKRYGINVKEERKLIFGKDSKKKAKEVMFIYETVKNPSLIGITYDCVEKVIKGEDK